MGPITAPAIQALLVESFEAVDGVFKGLVFVGEVCGVVMEA